MSKKAFGFDGILHAVHRVGQGRTNYGRNCQDNEIQAARVSIQGCEVSKRRIILPKPKVQYGRVPLNVRASMMLFTKSRTVYKMP